MKTKLILIVIFLSVNIFAQEERVKIFPFKSAIIEYKYEAGLGGTHVKYIDDYGYKQADIIKKEIKLGDNIEKQYETIILIGNKAYTITYENSTVVVGRNATYDYYLKHKNREPIEITEAIIKSSSFEFNGTEHFLGKECKVWKAHKAKKLTWNGVELKSTITFMMMMVEKATSIKINVDIPSDKFDIPKGFTYNSSDTYQGFSGLDLKFVEDNKIKSENVESIKINFSSNSLGGTNNIPYYTQKGEKVIQDGVNDFNKIDFKIIKSQLLQLKQNNTELGKSRTLIFFQKDGYGKESNIYGKIQINKIDENSFSYRYMTFGDDGEITGYSNKTNSALAKIFEITPDKNNWKLILKPKNKTKCIVLGW